MYTSSNADYKSDTKRINRVRDVLGGGTRKKRTEDNGPYTRVEGSNYQYAVVYNNTMQVRTHGSHKQETNTCIRVIMSNAWEVVASVMDKLHARTIGRSFII